MITGCWVIALLTLSMQYDQICEVIKSSLKYFQRIDILINGISSAFHLGLLTLLPDHMQH